MEFPLSVDEVKREAEALRESDLKIALVHGCFDPLHDGHRDLFKEASRLGTVFCGIDDDDSVSAIKGKGRPEQDVRSRVKAILDTGLVDFAFTLGPQHSGSGYSDYFRELYVKIEPDFLVTADGPHLAKREKDLDGLGAELIVMKKTIYLR